MSCKVLGRILSEVSPKVKRNTFYFVRDNGDVYEWEDHGLQALIDKLDSNQLKSLKQEIINDNLRAMTPDSLSWF